MYVQRLMKLAGGATDRDRFDAYIEKHPGKLIYVYDTHEPKCSFENAECVRVAPGVLTPDKLVYYYLYTVPIPDIGMPVMTRADAQRQGLRYYWTGKPCNRGHAAPRSTKTGVCRQCNCENAARYRKEKKQLEEKGIKTVNVAVHADDVAQIEAYAAALRLQRGVM